MKYFLITCFLVFTSGIAEAKPGNDLLRANYLYSRQAFGEAIEYYRKAVTANTNSLDAIVGLADSYRATKQPEQAAPWYEKAVAMNGCPDIVKFNYAQVLMNLQQYDKALPVLKEYQSKAPADRRVSNMIASCQNRVDKKVSIPAGTAHFASFNTDRSEFGAAFKGNELYFTSDTIISGLAESKKAPSPFYAIYGTTCNGQAQCGPLKTIGGNINTKYHDGPCTFASDGTMYFTRTNFEKKFLTKSPIPDNNDVVRLQIIIASNYDEQKNVYNRLETFPYNNKNYSTAHPALNEKGDMLIFASDMPGGEGGNDLYVCNKNSFGEWGAPVNLGKTVNTEGDEMFPFIGANNKLYFASDGHVGYGGLDVYEVDLYSNSKPVVANVGMPVNSSYDDMSLVLDKTGNSGYFSSNRPAPKKGDNIYSFTRQNLFLSVKIVDDRTGKAIPGATARLSAGNEQSSMVSDERGQILTPLIPGSAYAIRVAKVGYDSVSDNIAATTPKQNDTVFKTIRLTKGFNIQYNVVVVEEQTRQPLENTMLVFVKNSPFNADSMMLYSGQVFTTNLEENKTYNVYAIKDNYYGNEKFVSTKNLNPGASGVTLRDTIFMKKLQVGEVYKIDDIYYDYNKANIREDAKPSLNRLLELLNRYPQMTIQVNSHTDCRGSDAYNMKLSNARAQSVITYLNQRGIAKDRLKFKGFGESQPVDKCNVCEKCSETQHQNNRRTEFQILSL